MLSLWTKVRLLLELRAAEAQRNAERERLLRRYGFACTCPSCKRFLNDSVPEVLDEGLYRYMCECGVASTFDFCAPAPLLVDVEPASSNVLGLGA